MHGTRITPPTNIAPGPPSWRTSARKASPSGRLQPPRVQPEPPRPMFSTFLIGIVLASLLSLVGLLFAPRPADHPRLFSAPVGLALAVLFAALGFLGGFALGS